METGQNRQPLGFRGVRQFKQARQVRRGDPAPPVQPTVDGGPVHIEVPRDASHAAGSPDEVLEHCCLVGHRLPRCRIGNKSRRRHPGYVRAMNWRERLKTAREEQNLSVAEVAARLDVDRSTVHRWESGNRKPDVADLMRWGAALGVEIVVTERTPPPTDDRERLVQDLQAHIADLDPRAIAMLQAQLDFLTAGLVKKVS